MTRSVLVLVLAIVACTKQPAKEPVIAEPVRTRSPDLSCKQDSDCVMYTMRECCDHCGGTPMNGSAAAKAREVEEKRCATLDVKCPVINCPVQGVTCVNEQCVVRQ